MRKFLLIVTLASFVFVLASPSYTQSVRGTQPIDTLRVSIPFDFTVSDAHLTAGDYLLFIDTFGSVIHIRNIATNEQIVVFTSDIISRDRPTTDRLVFRQDGQQNVLHRVWSTQAGHVHDILHSKAVKEL